MIYSLQWDNDKNFEQLRKTENNNRVNLFLAIRKQSQSMYV